MDAKEEHIARMVTCQSARLQTIIVILTATVLMTLVVMIRALILVSARKTGIVKPGTLVLVVNKKGHALT
jgi:hypothetical protein